MPAPENDLIVGPAVVANGVDTIVLDFLVEEASYIQVFRGASDTPLILDTDYTFTGEGTATGIVTLTTPANGTDAYAVYLNQPLGRSSDLQFRGDLRSTVLNPELNRLWRAIQQLSTKLGRSFQFSRTAALIPSFSATAGDFLRLSADGSEVEGVAPSLLGVVAAPIAADSVAALLTDTLLSYDSLSVGDYVRTLAEGYAFVVAASGASDHDIATAGGVKLYSLEGPTGYGVGAFGAVGDGVTDNSAALTAALARSNGVAVSTVGNGFGVGTQPSALGHSDVDANGLQLINGEPGGELTDRRPVLWIEKHIDNDIAVGRNPAAVIYMNRNGGVGNESRAEALFVQISDTDGGNGFIEAGRFNAVALQTSADLRVFGIFTSAAAATGVSVKRTIGIEANVTNNSGVDAPTTFDKNTFNASFIATSNLGITGKKNDVAFVVNPFLTAANQFQTGFLVPLDSVANIGFKVEAVLTVGLDLASGTYSTAAIRVPNSTNIIRARNAANSANDEVMTYDSSDRLILASGGSQRLRLQADGVNLLTGNPLRYNGSSVVGERRTGWAAATGTATRSTFATSTVTTEQLAQRLKALIDDLTVHGLIGS